MPRYRQGSKVPLNVYDGNRPLFQAHSVEDAEESVLLLNLGDKAREIRDAWGVKDGLLRFMQAETPPGSPVSEIEPGEPQDTAESREGHTGLVTCVRCSHGPGSHRGTVGEGDPLTHCRAPGCGCDQFEEW